MLTTIGEAIYACRIKQGLSRNEFALKYVITGPAVFKFEKGHMRPKLELWLKMARDSKIPEMTAVLLWLKSRLPERLQNLIQIKNLLSESEVPSADGPPPSGVDVVKDGPFGHLARLARGNTAMR